MCLHETGIEYFQGKLENFFCSRGSFVFTINFGGTTQVVRSSSDRRDVKFFLFLVDGSPIGSRRQFPRAASKKNYADRFAPAARYGLRDLGSRRAHFHRTFLGDSGFVRRVLFDDALYPGSLRNQTEVLIILEKIFAQDKGGDNFDAKNFFVRR